MNRLSAGIGRQNLITQGLFAGVVFLMALFVTGCTLVRSETAESLPEWMQVQPDLIRVRQPDTTVAISGKVAQSSGAALLYSSYIGGDGVDYGKDVAVDADGNIYIIGQTFSDTLFDTEIVRAGYSDVFVAKFDPTGSELLYSVVIGGDDSEYPLAIEVDAQGNVYGTGYVSDETFPLKDALWSSQAEYSNSFLFKLDGSGEIVYSTYLPFDVFYSRHNLAVDKAGNAYVTGSYPWMTVDDELLRDQVGLVKLDPTGTELLLDLHIGGNGTDRGIAITLDNAGNIYLAGSTSEGDGFPVTENALQSECGDLIYAPDSYCYDDGVVVVLNPAGEVRYASYHGGSFTDTPNAIGTDGKGNVMIAGDTASSRFPFANAIQESCVIATYSDDCESGRPYVSVFHFNLQDEEEQATLTYSTYLAATDRNSTNTVLAATMDSMGNAYITGYTSGKKFPLLNAVQDELYQSFCYTFSSERYCFDAFLAKLSPTGDLLMGSYVGAAYDEYPYGLAVDGKGTIYLAGTTEADDFPTTDNAYETFNLLDDDAFLVKIALAKSRPSPPPPPPPGALNFLLPALEQLQGLLSIFTAG